MEKETICLVPMVVEALPVDSNTLNSQPFRRFTMNHKEWLSPEPGPFQPTVMDRSDMGVYLHWTLPQAFRNAVELVDGDHEYRTVPNRWLVVRKQAGNSPSAYRYWVVESDALHNEPSAGSPWSSDFGAERIGITIPLPERTPNPAIDYLEELTVMGPGDPSFAAYQPNCIDVFSMIDPLNGIDEGTLEYVVIGWFNNPHRDPLHEIRSVSEFIEKLGELDWRIDGDVTMFANRTFIYGQVKGLSWKREAASSRIPRQSAGHLVSVGMTSVDAFSEMLGAFTLESEEEEGLSPSNLLETHMYNQLRTFEEPDGTDTLDIKIHQTGFEQLPGGSIWNWTYREEQQPFAVQQDPYRDRADRKLSELNREKIKSERMYRQVKKMKQELYEVWWKWRYKYKGRESESGELQSYAYRLGQMILEFETQAEKVDFLYRNFADTFKDKMLIPNSLPRFWRPQDPAVLITGIKETLTDREGRLPFCKIKQYAFSEDQFPGNYDGLPHGLYEAMLDLLQMDEAQPWSLPWEPIFLEWKLKWFPMPFNEVNWEFQGEEYVCKTEPMTSQAQILTGRTWLGPQAIGYLEDRIRQLRKDLAESNSNAARFERRLESWKVLSQALEGLLDQLILRDVKAHPVAHDIDEILQGEDSRVIPDKQAFAPSSSFQSIISGHFRLEQLDIIDRFGQLEQVSLAGNDPLVAQSLACEPAINGVVELKPRLAQPMLLNVNWVSAKDDRKEYNLDYNVNPVCGWILPNHLDRGLLVYSPQGQVLGEVRIAGSGRTSKVHWEPAPDVPFTTLQSLKDSYNILGQVLIGLESAGGSALLALEQSIDETLWMIEPKGRSFARNMAVFLGRPLVLTRVKVGLELDCPMLPVHDSGKNYNSDRDQHPYYRLELPIGVGNSEKLNSGILGYYEGDDYSKFYAVHAYTGPDRENSTYIQVIGEPDLQDPINRKAYLRLKISKSLKCKTITILMDPTAPIHLNAGLIPEKQLELPEKFRVDNTGILETLFQGGPILTAFTTDDQTPKILYPKPNDTLGNWTWIERTKSSGEEWPTQQYPIKPTDHKDFATAQDISVREGWLKLTVKESD
ncbi:hypothetical protein [Paenibacillus sp. URB8-2]|uniref:hypothetical protein n=1 Tax=Paenibacillus sp. URB8-2 TaxID=2741301 RepID=UPI0015B9B740|nr:hypothetical protein [Paenibacillus sp. URB8-2]BCG59258.1 hypothetical protein PUR_26830 [Paenibacillus sp. URB8-2]